MTDNILFLWDNMTELGIATNEELGLACALCGTTEETQKNLHKKFYPILCNFF